MNLLEDVYNVINSKENLEFIKSCSAEREKFERMIYYDSELKHNFKRVMKYLYKDKNPFSIFVRTDYSNMNCADQQTMKFPTAPNKIVLSRHKPQNNNTKYISISSGSSCEPLALEKYGTPQYWDDGISYFSHLAGYSEIGNSLTHCLFDYPNVFDEFCTHLNKDGEEVFCKLKEEYNKKYLKPIVNCKIKINLENITSAETKVLNIKPGAYISLNTYRRGFTFFTCNKNFNDKPKINTKWLYGGDVSHITIFENIFVNSHLDEYKKILNDYKLNESKWLDEHLEFEKVAIDLIEKYLVADKL